MKMTCPTRLFRRSMIIPLSLQVQRCQGGLEFSIGAIIKIGNLNIGYVTNHFRINCGRIDFRRTIVKSTGAVAPLCKIERVTEGFTGTPRTLDTTWSTVRPSVVTPFTSAVTSSLEDSGFIGRRIFDCLNDQQLLS